MTRLHRTGINDIDDAYRVTTTVAMTREFHDTLQKYVEKEYERLREHISNNRPPKTPRTKEARVRWISSLSATDKRRRTYQHLVLAQGLGSTVRGGQSADEYLREQYDKEFPRQEVGRPPGIPRPERLRQIALGNVLQQMFAQGQEDATWAAPAKVEHMKRQLKHARF